MTYVVGAVCSDGAILVADRAVSRSTGRVIDYVPKLAINRAQLAAACAGDRWDCEQFLARFKEMEPMLLRADAERAVHQLILAVQAEDHTPVMFPPEEAAMLRRFGMEPALPLGWEPRPVSVLLAGVTEGKAWLSVSRHADPFEPVLDVATIGARAPWYDAFLKVAFDSSTPMQVGAVFAWFAIARIELRGDAPGVGVGRGAPDIVFVSTGAAPSSPSHDEVARMRRDVTSALENVTSHD